MNKESKSLVIQFIHSGKTDKRIGHILRNEDSHKRRLIKNEISFVDNGKLVEKQKGYFWGEWEAGVYNEKEDAYTVSTVKYPCDTLINSENRLNSCKTACGGKLNTDPYVFGNYFIYSNCMQQRYKKLKKLKENDIIIFGSHKADSFVLDTVFVVDKIITESEKAKLSHCFKTATLNSLDANCVIYCGKTYKDNPNGLYSFFPCNDKPFDRPEIKADGISQQTQGIHYIKDQSAEEIWKQLKMQTEKICKIGVWAKEPQEE